MTKRRHGAKKISRNKKSYWRKGTDISAIEQYEESVRENERLGITTKSDADLFFVHKEPSKESDEIVRRVKKVELKCFHNLKPDSAVKPLSRQIKSSKKLRLKREKQSNKIGKKPITTSECSTDKQQYDLWGEDCETKNPSTSSLEPDLEDYYLRQTKRRLPKTPSSVLQLTTKLAKMETPHPGQSYNPTFVDHQKLLKQALLEEISKEKKENKIERKLKITGQIATEESKLAELREGLKLFKEERKSDEEETSDDDELPATDQGKKLLILPINAENRKLTVQKKKELLEKKTKKEKSKEKQNNKLQNDIYRLRSIKNEIKQKEEKTLKRIQRRAQLKETKFYKPAVLSRHKYEPAELELHLAHEVPGSLREIKVINLEDMFETIFYNLCL